MSGDEGYQEKSSLEPDISGIEEQVLSFAIKDVLSFAEVVEVMAEYPWKTGIIKFLFSIAYNFWKAEGGPPSRAYLIAETRKLEQDQEKRTEIALCIGRLFNEKLRPQEVTSLMMVLLDSYLEDETLSALERAAEKLNEGDVKAARTVMVEYAAEGGSKPLAASGLFDGGFSMVSADRIPTGIRPLDEMIAGIATGENAEMGLIIATPGMGKSTFLTELSHTAIGIGRRVLYIDTENGEGLVKARNISRFTHIPVNILRSPKMNAHYTDIFNSWRQRNETRLNERLKIVSPGYYESPLHAVEASISKLIARGWIPDLILFDSPDHIAMEDGFGQMWEWYKTLWNRMKRMGKRFRAGMWATSQGNPAFEGKIATLKAYTNSMQTIQAAQIVVSINCGIDEESGRILLNKEAGNNRTLLIAKSRESKGLGVLIPLTVDLPIARFSGTNPPDDIGEYEE